jgi:hypothetical protein
MTFERDWVHPRSANPNRRSLSIFRSLSIVGWRCCISIYGIVIQISQIYIRIYQHDFFLRWSGWAAATEYKRRYQGQRLAHWHAFNRVHGIYKKPDPISGEWKRWNTMNYWTWYPENSAMKHNYIRTQHCHNSYWFNWGV